MSRGLRFEPEAKQELWDSIDYYNRKSSGLGWEFADEVDGVGARILSDPFRFRRARGEIRRAFLKRFKYWIYFQSNQIGSPSRPCLAATGIQTNFASEDCYE
jgi:toxin ParE1/3/4